MKHLPLKNTTYKNLENGFTNWLETLGYARSTVDGSPSYVKAFFFYLESKEIFFIDKITNYVIRDYFVYLSRRKNQNKAGSLSLNSLRNNLGALKRFGKYLRETEQGNLEVEMHLPVNKYPAKEILTQKEIKELYEATDQTILGMRDKAMLSVYYGCGLRRNEGVSLNVEDILLDRNKLIVRKGKGYKERIVPITGIIKDDLESYMNYARTVLTERNPQEKAFFIGSRGNRISGNMLYERLKQLREKAGIIKETGLHTLRHSIATHLLQDGMQIEYVSQFLGHSSLESTQIYTHLSAEGGLIK
ncbi:MAG: tyrosine-type recombinase/integrase [Ignavibacteriaceae bacterium]|nr:tyrosine-type recombinase/integrase [Ignavibacteriaceae bacterium]